MSSNASFATAAFRLSTQQKRAWLEHEQGLAQFAQCSIRISEPLDIEKLKSVLQQLTSKYEILQTTLRQQTGIQLPFQIIRDDRTIPLKQRSGDPSALDGMLRREVEL